MIITQIILAVCLLLSVILLHKFYSENSKLKKELSNQKGKNTEMEKFNKELMLIEPGDKVIFPDYGLIIEKGTPKEVNFEVTYELEVLEVSTDKVKVKALDFTSTHKVGRDTANKQGIINFMQDKWVSKVDVQLVVDDSIKRDIKLRELGIV
jgi:hypothetical protein